MDRQLLNHISGRAIIVLSFLALLAVLSGYTQPPLPDEGAGAHIFQIAIVLLVPVMLLFFVTADWRRPWRSARTLLLSVATLVLAFGALYHLEHHP